MFTGIVLVLAYIGVAALTGLASSPYRIVWGWPFVGFMLAWGYAREKGWVK
jgi:hypothetical protein